MKRPEVTILMTSYNHGKFIRESIESVLRQSFSDFELIIVDDCSFDDSFEIIKSYTDDRIIAIRNEKNMGPEHAFEIMLKMARGKYIAIADSDNVWVNDKLEKQINFLKTNSGYAAVFTRVQLIDGDGEPFQGDSAYAKIFDVENRSRQEWLKQFFYHGNCLCHPSILIKREMYDECGMMVNGLWQVPDFYKWIRLCLKKEIYVLEERLVKFRLHENNISGEGNVEGNTRLNNEVYHTYELFYEVSEEDFPAVFDIPDEYKKNGQIKTNFVLSKMLLELGVPAAQELGLNKLFEILNNESERGELFELYKYNNVSYKEDETRYCPFLCSESMPIRQSAWMRILHHIKSFVN